MWRGEVVRTAGVTVIKERKNEEIFTRREEKKVRAYTLRENLCKWRESVNGGKVRKME